MSLKQSTSNGILVATISRPEALNALNFQVIDHLEALVVTITSTLEIRGMILTGDGDKAFVAGADIKELSSLSKAQAFEQVQKVQKLFKRIEDCPKPIIAAVNGFALGGGCELAMACHMRLATENAKFGQPEVNLGIIPGYGGTQRLTQLVGRGKALELLLTGDMVSAQEAKSLGLVNHVYATKDEMLTAAESIIQKISTKGPIAVANIIKSVNAGFAFENKGYDTEAQLFSECAETEDFKEGTSAFIEKRKANFKGR